MPYYIDENDKRRCIGDGSCVEMPGDLCFCKKPKAGTLVYVESCLGDKGLKILQRKYKDLKFEFVESPASRFDRDRLEWLYILKGSGAQSKFVDRA